MNENIKKEEKIIFKVSVLGHSSVGKTSFIHCFCGTHLLKNLGEIGVYKNKRILKRDNKRVELKIFDSVGQERFKCIPKSYFESADGIILIYDVSNQKSFIGVKDWIINIKNIINLNKVGCVIVANNCDIDKEKWEVTDGMKQNLIETENVKVIEASAKNNINVSETFDFLVDEMIKLGKGKKSNRNENDDVQENLNALNNKNKNNKNEGCFT